MRRVTVDSVNLLIFGTAESAVTIIAVSIPILRALLYISDTPPKPRTRFYQQPSENMMSDSPVLANDIAKRDRSSGPVLYLQGVDGTGSLSEVEMDILERETSIRSARLT